MNKKNIKIKRSFIPQRIGDSIKKINRNFTSKFGKFEFIIHSKWDEIAGSYFKNFSEPKNITKLPDFENDIGETIYKNQLNVSVAPAAAIEFQHYKDTIIEKINSHFGYKAIKDLRIHQNYIPKYYKSNRKNEKMNLSTNEKTDISKVVKEVKNQDLRKSLIDLGENIAKEDK
tara:strand:- start:66 stop:584 length:519 start_codon:yes stop_codon:yes gene_type:complete